ncbi:unnamed protein product [Tilletia controversa]|uniref:Uncharacterized protein n=3 Tax=Tilletia TaxID=13289 RepID=A0A8X7SU31_9BASI|nr:hypothetical protein CF336_g6812 [Tilletia laevis]KAE8188639.1 hypothetical protein CF328_g6538 [Tilletia controversa]KAE8256361.1 hypothetical protein A4X03_0g5411 [Tilletia caries]KAE8191389.1 hypothetical protein CF335_g6103 [Tilletia laevis]KAE8242059.1 hypothetical protein A4X06_0g7280 [Tilletia controversa]
MASAQHYSSAAAGAPPGAGPTTAASTSQGGPVASGSGTSAGAAAATATAPTAGTGTATGTATAPSASEPLSILSTTLTLTPRRLAVFKPGKVFDEAVKKGKDITSLAFDAKGDYLLTAGEDDVFNLYSCKKGKLTKTFYSKKYGIDLARFTHKPDSILHASTRGDNTIRFHSLTENKYISYFKGHESRVTSLQMSPVDDTFMSAAANESVRLWDLKSSKAFGKLRMQGHGIAAYDSSGQVIAIALNERAAVVLYDIKQFEKAPFLTIRIDDSAALSQISYPPRYPVITYLEFAPGAGSTLLVGTAGGVHYLIDAFSGALRRRLVGGHGGRIGLEPEGLAAVDAYAVSEKEAEEEKGNGDGGGGPEGEGGKEEEEGEKATPRSMFVPGAGISGSECCFTPDGSCIVSGSATGQIFVWQVPADFREVDNGRNLDPVAVLHGHQGPSRCVGFNPRSAMLASAGRKLAFWLPDLDEE